MPLYAPLNLAALPANIVPDGNATRNLGAASFDWATVRTRRVLSSVADAADAVGVIIDTGAAYTTGGALICSFRNNAVEKAKVDKDGVATVEQLLPTAAAAKQLGGQSNDWARLYTRSVFSSVPDGASAVGVEIDAPNITNAASKIATFGVNGSVKASIDVVGDLLAVGGFRQTLGPWVRDNVAATLTDSAVSVGTTAAPQSGWAAPRSGSVVGLSIVSTVAAAGADLTAKVFKAGSAIASCQVVLASATSDTKKTATFTKDTHTFAANDVLDIRITTPGGWSATTADIVVWIELES